MLRRRLLRQQQAKQWHTILVGNTYQGVGSVVASWLVRSSPDRAVPVRALAGDVVLCSWARHFTLSTSLYPGVKMGTGELNAGGNPAMD